MGLLGSVYGIWEIYAAGVNYLLIALVIYAIGIPVFMKARKELDPGQKEFTNTERYCAIGLVVLGIIELIYLFKFM